MKKSKYWNKYTKIAISLIIFSGIIFFNFFFDKKEPKELTHQEFQQMVDKDEVKSIVIIRNTEKLLIEDKDKKMYEAESPNYESFKKELLESGIEVSMKTTGKWTSIASSLITLLIYGGLIFIIYRSMNIGGSKKMQTPVNIPKTTFSTIAGYSEQKDDLTTYVNYLKNPKTFQDRGAHMPKGVLLYGPPGTGKTLFARGVAGEAGVPFFSVNGSDFVEMFVGLGAKRVRSLFQNAREQSPCIIFIDEIDAIGAQRSEHQGSEQTQTINALLSEMDGFEQDSGILVLATTNRPDNLDNALTRSGRFDSHIAIPLPSTKEDRLQIIEVHKQDREFADDVDFKTLAKNWVGFSGADIESLLNEASIIAVTKNYPTITKECIDDAFYKKVLKGHVKKKGQLERKKEELELVAYHEAGHAITRRLLDSGEVSKVTILSTTSGAGGVTFNVPEKMGLFSMQELESEVKVLYAGRVAEYLLYNKDIKKVTTGAQNDIERATDIIKGMIMEYGLQQEPTMLNLSRLPEMNSFVFEQMKELSNKLFEETVSLIDEHYELLETVANRLLEKETIEADELNDMIEKYFKQSLSVA